MRFGILRIGIRTLTMVQEKTLESHEQTHNIFLRDEYNITIKIIKICQDRRLLHPKTKVLIH